MCVVLVLFLFEHCYINTNINININKQTTLEQFSPPMPGSAMSTVSCKSFLSSLFEAFSDRLNNQAIAGSIALAGASLLSKIAWKFFVVISSRIKEALFSVYIIPKNTAQYTYFMAWLKVKKVRIQLSILHVLSFMYCKVLLYFFSCVWQQNQPAISTGVMQVRGHRFFCCYPTIACDACR